MIFTDEKLSELRLAVKERLSHKRFTHTLGVEEAAIRLGEYLMPSAVSELRAAALLHDISKELSDGEQLEILKSTVGVTDDDILSPSVYHSLTAPFVVKRDFPDFASENLLSSLENHTTGSPDMSLFDEIIFIADFVEEGRSYAACTAARERLFSRLESAGDTEECEQILHLSVIETLDFTIKYLIDKHKYLNGRTVATRNAFLGRYPKALDKED